MLGFPRYCIVTLFPYLSEKFVFIYIKQIFLVDILTIITSLLANYRSK